MRANPLRSASALADGTMVLGGRLTRAALGFAINVFVARWLGPEGYGVFWLFLVTLIIGQSLLGEGFDPGLVRYYAYRARHDPDRAGLVISTALVIRLLIGVPGVIAGVLVAGWIASTPDGHVALQAGVLGALAGALWSFVLAVLQARQAFRAHAATTPLLNVARMAGIGALLAVGHLTVGTLIMTHVLALYVCALAGLWSLRTRIIGSGLSGSVLRELVTFSSWTALANLCFLAQSYLAVPILDHLGGPTTAGLFGAGAALLQAGEHLVVSILTVQLPRVSELAGPRAYARHVRRTLPWYLGCALLLGPIALVARPVVLLVYGPEYAAAATVFQLLFVGFLATLVTHPLYLVFYAMDRPQLYAASAIVSSVGWGVAAVALIPGWGAVGAAWATMIARLVQGAVIVALLWWVIGRRPDRTV